jgi:MFS family permease
VRVGTVGNAVRETTTSLRTIWRNVGLRRLNLALAGSMIGDWAYATAVIVWAYGNGGAAAVGIWGAVKLGLAAVATPFLSVLADRYPRVGVMVASDLSRAVVILAAAAAVAFDAPAPLVYVLATVASLLGAVFRPAQMALTPSLARSPEQLTAANGVGSTLESLSFFLGPAIGALLLTVASVPVVFLLNVVTFLWSAALVLSISRLPRLEPSPDETPAPADGDSLVEEAEQAEESFWAEASAGFRVIAASPDLRLITALYCLQTLIAGASLVFEVVMAVDLLGIGAEGVGFLDSVMGVGALVGGLVAISLASRGRLASDFGVGVALWAVPLLLVTIWPQAAVAFLAMFVIGVANPLADVNANTILQRLAPDAVLARVFGALDAALIAAMAVGALLMPVLVDLLGIRWALAAIALPVVALTLLAFPRLRRLDTQLAEPPHLALLRDQPVFAPLLRSELERVALQLAEVRVPAGFSVIRQGEEGDRFYLVEDGEVQVLVDGEPVGVLAAGECFGEIALLRDVPRTASVVALTECVLQSLEREAFLDAVSDTEVRSRADALAAKRVPVY